MVSALISLSIWFVISIFIIVSLFKETESLGKKISDQDLEIRTKRGDITRMSNSIDIKDKKIRDISERLEDIEDKFRALKEGVMDICGYKIVDGPRHGTFIKMTKEEIKDRKKEVEMRSKFPDLRGFAKRFFGIDIDL